MARKSLIGLALMVSAGLVGGACRSVSNDATGSSASGTPPDTGGREPVVSTTDWPMFGFVPARTSDGPASTGVGAGDLGRLVRRQVPLPGTVDASPIYLHQVTVGGATRDVFVVTTTYGRTIALDADSGSLLWTYTPAGYDGWAGSRQITTAAPVADPDRAHVYASAPDGAIRKLALADGHALWTTPITRLPAREKIAAALNFDEGHVLATTGGYIGDAPPYQGHVAVLDAASGRLLHVWNALCSDRSGLLDPSTCPQSGAAIWARRGVVVEPDSHRLLVATGDGHFDGTHDWGDSVVELAPDASAIAGHWTPTDYQLLDDSDADLGSAGPAWLAGGYLAQGGKDGQLRLLALSRVNGPLPATGGELQTVPTPGGARLFADPAVWQGSWLFVADGSGTVAWRLVAGQLQQSWSNGTAGTSPVVAGGLLWIYDPHGGLNVYRPESGERVGTLPAGSGHWQSPIVADGRIALAQGNANDHATSGVLNIYSLR